MVSKNNIQCPKIDEYKALSLTYLDSPITEVFPTTTYLFQFHPSLGGKWGIKVGPKVQTLCLPFYHKNSNSSKNFSSNIFVC